MMGMIPVGCACLPCTGGWLAACGISCAAGVGLFDDGFNFFGSFYINLKLEYLF